MNEAPKYEQLLKVAEVHNPNWYPFIHGYLKGELPNLELDYNDLELEEEPQLFMGNYDSCVVAEPFGFKSVYAHNGIENCFVCARFADKLAYTSSYFGTFGSDAKRESFALYLENFYKHRGFMK